ncbi:MAG: DNA primase [Candidatus Hydrogenedentes bacterium]|nr:DNA primase [Candidatus Hydrogenedentota bacterium]
MGKYSREVVTQVLAAIDIVDIIGGAVELKPSGHRLLGLCPFHNEKTPSFSVSRERQQFYCFGCEKGGDALAFVMDFEGLSFAEALRKLADRAGVQLPAPSERESREDFARRNILELYAFAAQYYGELLKNPLKGGRGRTYLKTRTLKDATTAKFGLGYAPDSYTTLVEAARTKNIKDYVLENSGLAKRGNKGLYDLFRERLMIPIRDVMGNVVAFGGRDLTGTAPGKYINSPENPVYRKSRVLYGLFEARDGLRQTKQALLVEGYFDLMRCFDAGITNVVATCGTALTTEQAALIRRYVPEVVVVYDGDPAGIRAALRGVAILTAAGLTVRALVLPDGKDPDDFIRDAGGDAFRALVDGALNFVTFYIRLNGDRLGTIEGRTTVAREVFTIVQSIDDTMRVDEYLKLVARELQLDEWNVRREFAAQLQQRDVERSIEVRRAPSSERKPIHPDDQAFLAAILAVEPLRDRAREGLKGVELGEGPVADVLGAICKAGNDLSGLRFEDEAAQALFAAAANQPPMPSDKAEALVEKRICSLKREVLMAKSARVQEQIREAERSRDLERISQLLSTKVGIDREIQKLGAA